MSQAHRLNLQPLRASLGLIVLLAVLWMASSKSVAQQAFDVSKAWDYAEVYLPGNLMMRRPDSVTSDKAFPAVVFLHGCGGITDHERRWAQHLKSEGFVAVFPDSLRIPGRQRNCTQDPSFNGEFSNVLMSQLRPAEFAHTMSQLKNSSWVDQKNIFLMGHSEGAMAAYLIRDESVRGVVISGFPCSEGGALRGPLRAPLDTATLVVNWELDTSFARPGRPYIQCADRPFWRLRTSAAQVLLPGQGHPTGFSPLARDAVTQFLRQSMNRDKPN
jgi:hypothetical protein